MHLRVMQWHGKHHYSYYADVSFLLIIGDACQREWPLPRLPEVLHFAPSSPSLCLVATHMNSSFRLDFHKDCPPPKPCTITTTIMRQTSLNLPRVAHAATSPLTSMLSQYELLTMLCENLSSADIVHLGATSREHWQYVGHNSVIFKGLIADSTCDGKGIIAQARVFGHWKAKPEKATRKCKGRDAKPCSDCGAMVCNVG